MIPGSSGAVLGVTLTAASGFSSGKIQLENIKIVAPDANATTSKPGTYIYNVTDAVTLTAKSYTRQYGEANPTFGYEVTSRTITSGTPTITCSATASSPVGTYDIVIAKGSVTNGMVNLVKGTLTITKAPLTISAGSYTKVEGDANPTFTPTFSGFKNGETKNVLTKQPTITCTATTASTPGSYPVTVSGAEAQNYSISYVNGTLTVTAKVVPEPYAVLSDDGKTVTFYYDGKKASRGGVGINNSNSSSPYSTATTAVIDASFADYRPTSTAYWFYKCSSLTSIIGIENLHTDSVTNVGGMFSGCSSLTSLDVSGFKTDKVTNMSYMFSGCSKLTSLDVSGFKTDNVTDMRYMFNGCSRLTSLEVSGFKTDNVTNMGSMFGGCSSLTSLDVSGFNTDKVTYMRYMFSGCSSLTSLDVSGFKTDNVTNMHGMFEGCSGLKSLNLSGWSNNKVTEMQFMFYGCSSLKTIYASEENWSTAKVTSFGGSAMFTGCTSLIGGNGTKYDASHVGVEYACIDKEGQPGYLTEKSKSLTPSSGEEEVYGSDDDGQYDDLDGNVIGNILYSIEPTGGGYNKSEGCIEVTKPTNDDDMDAIAGKDPFGEDVRNNFTGIIFMVSAGKGTIKVNAETTGGMLLKVKIGNDEPTEMELDGKLKATFHYNVTKPTYVYIYASYSGAASARGNGEEPSLKIYGIEWKQDAGTPTGVDSLTTNPSLKDEGSVYTLGGQRIDALPKKKGVYIRGGKKFVR